MFTASLSSFLGYVGVMDIHRNAAGEVFRVAAAYEEALTPTASSGRSGEHHRLTMTTGLASTILELTLFCFTQRDFFATIGDAAAETSPPVPEEHIPGLWLLMSTLDGMRELPPDARRVVPIDPHRHVAAIYLAILMMRFVWFHELAHGLLGHTDYRRSLSGEGTCRLDELTPIDERAVREGIDSHTLQCMELEADGWALSRCLVIQHRDMESVDGIRVLPHPLRVRLALFAAYAMTWLFEAFQVVLYRRKLSVTHPAPFTRLQILQSTATRELADLGGDAPAIARDAIGQLLVMLPRLGREWESIDRFHPKHHGDAFAALREKLAPFRYVVPEWPHSNSTFSR